MMITLKVIDTNPIELKSASIPVDGVISVNGKQGVVVLTEEDINIAPITNAQIDALFE